MGCDCWEWVHRAGAHPVVDAPMDDPNHFFRSSMEGPIALVTHVLTAQPCPTALYVPSPSRAQSPPLAASLLGAEHARAVQRLGLEAGRGVS